MGKKDPVAVKEALAKEIRKKGAKAVIVPWENSRRMGDVLDLMGADLRNADFRGISLCNALLEEANLEGADLTGAALSNLLLLRVRFVNADLEKSSLAYSDVYGTDFRGANLRYADLTGSAGWERIVEHPNRIDEDNREFILAHTRYAMRKRH